jgi:hypothetical protein
MTWLERIIAARTRGCFTDKDRYLAGKWSTCAVGEQHAALPDVVVYVTSWIGAACPLDIELRWLGGQWPEGRHGFLDAVIANDFDGAERALHAIEDRVQELKRAAH